MFRRRHRAPPALPAACLPPDTRIYAIGDIHGRNDCLEKLLVQIATHLAKHPIASANIVFLGDYVDRGAHSKQVINSILTLQTADIPVTCLMGNHEWALLRFVDGTMSYDDWYPWGGDSTLESYGIAPPPPENDTEISETLRQAFIASLPAPHLTFLRNLMLHYQCGDYLFVHAGLRPHVALEAQKIDDILTIRGDFLRHPVTLPQTIIHGHTIFASPHIRPRSIGIDTGAYASGRLTAIMLEGSDYHFLTT